MPRCRTRSGAGDVLAGRYRLVDLLSESAGGRFWRAHDHVLDRHVALHVIAPTTSAPTALLEAARRSATVHDRRFLRVLDADRSDDLCFVVNEWGSGTSLDIMLASDGPLAPRRAAWIVSEVADAWPRRTTPGVAHGRLVPENVLIDHTGAGPDHRLRRRRRPARAAARATARPTSSTSAGAALRRAHRQVGRGLRARWCRRRRREHGRVLRPRQVRAGVPRPLDALCDEVHQPDRRRTTRDSCATSTTRAAGSPPPSAEFVGDPTGMAAAELAGAPADRTPARRAALEPPCRPDAHPAPTTAARRSTGPTPTARPTPEPEPATDGRAETRARARREPPEPPSELPTQAGVPDLRRRDRRGRLDPAAQRAAAAAAAVRGAARAAAVRARPARRPARTPPATRRRRPRSRRDYWPWDAPAGTGAAAPAAARRPPADDDERRRRRPGPQLAAARRGARARAVLLLVAVVVAFNLGRGDRSAASPTTTRPTPAPTVEPTAAPPTPIAGVTAADFDPQGDAAGGEPRPTPARRRRRPGTSWPTSPTSSSFGPGGLKTGVGLLLDLGDDPATSREVEVTLVGEPHRLSALPSPTSAPTGVAGLTPSPRRRGDGAGSTSTSTRPRPGRYLVVWLTVAPAVDGGFRGEIAEVVVRRMTPTAARRRAHRRRAARRPRRRRPRRVRRRCSRRHRDRLWAVALRTMGNPEDAADGLQDGMIAAFRRAGSFRGEAAVTTWLHRVVVNACLDRMRAAKVRRADPLPDDLEEYGRPRLAGPADRRRATRRTLAVPTSAAGWCSPRSPTCPPSSGRRWCWSTWRATRSPRPRDARRRRGTVKSRCSRGRARLAPLLGVLAPGVAARRAPGNLAPPRTSQRLARRAARRPRRPDPARTSPHAEGVPRCVRLPPPHDPRPGRRRARPPGRRPAHRSHLLPTSSPASTPPGRPFR